MYLETVSFVFVVTLVLIVMTITNLNLKKIDKMLIISNLALESLFFHQR
jgi:hypothetical protein